LVGTGVYGKYTNDLTHMQGAKNTATVFFCVCVCVCHTSQTLLSLFYLQEMEGMNTGEREYTMNQRWTFR